MVGQNRGRWVAGLMIVAGWWPVGSDPMASAGESRAKIAATSSLPSAGDHIRQHAFDGHPDTYFASEAPAKGGDHLTLTSDAPAVVKSIRVQSGRPDGGDVAEGGFVEVSEDGTTFDRVATFDPQGVAQADLGDRKLRSIRVGVARDLGHSLVIREFAIDSDRVKPFEHPVEITVRNQDAAELQVWTEAAARLCEQWYDALNDELASENFQPTAKIALTMRRNYRGVAAAGNGRISASARYFAEHQDDQGALIHETVHIIQNYPGRRNPGWLVEGVADYIRFFRFEPGKAGPVDPQTARYDASYRTTATFLDYLSRTYDPQIVRKLNRAMRQDTYDKALFEQLTGKPLEALGDEWRATLVK